MPAESEGNWGLRGLWRSSSRAQRAGFIALLAAGAVLRIAGILQTDQTAVVNMPLPDDAYYYFALARNAASGAGLAVSTDGTATVGFQPLWGLALIAVQSLFGGQPGFDLIAAAQALGAALGLASGLAVIGLTYRLTNMPSAGLLAGFSFLLSPQVLKHNLNGMETSLAILAAIVLAHMLLTPPDTLRDRRRSALLGLTGALAVLARTDLTILVAGGLALVAAQELRDRDGPALREAAPGLIVLAAGLIIPLFPWALVSTAIGGSPIPESGEAVRNLTLLVRHQPLAGPVHAIVDHPDQILPFYAGNAVEFTSAWMRQTPLLLPALLPLFAAFGLDMGLKISALLAVPLIVSLLWIIRREREAQRRLLGLWIFYAIAMTIAYSVFILGPWFYQRYTAPIAVLANPLLIAVAANLIPRAVWSKWAAPLLGLLIGVAFAALIGGVSYRWILSGPQAVPDDGFQRAALYLDEQLPPGSRVGVFSAGLINYYSDQVIIPLDGKVHRGARAALADGEMLRFLCDERIAYLADWPEMVRNLVERRSLTWHAGALDELAVIEVEAYNDLIVVQLTAQACSR